MKNLTFKEIVTIFIAAFLITFSILVVLDYITMKTETRVITPMDNAPWVFPEECHNYGTIKMEKQNETTK